MKKITILILLLTLSLSSFSQQVNPQMSLTKEDYLHKSKMQKKIAAIMSLGGAALVLTSFAIFPKDYAFLWGVNSDAEETMAGISVIAFFTGGAAILGSIPFFIASAKNKGRSMSFSLKRETSPQIHNSSFVYKSVPSLTLKIGL